MNRIIKILLSIIVILSITSCNKYNNNSTTEELDIIYETYNNKIIDSDLLLPSTLDNGEKAVWSSSDNNILSSDGKIGELPNGGLNSDGTLPSIKLIVEANNESREMIVYIKRLSKDGLLVYNAINSIKEELESIENNKVSHNISKDFTLESIKTIKNINGVTISFLENDFLEFQNNTIKIKKISDNFIKLDVVIKNEGSNVSFSLNVKISDDIINDNSYKFGIVSSIEKIDDLSYYLIISDNLNNNNKYIINKTNLDIEVLDNIIYKVNESGLSIIEIMDKNVSPLISNINELDNINNKFIKVNSLYSFKEDNSYYYLIDLECFKVFKALKNNNIELNKIYKLDKGYNELNNILTIIDINLNNSIELDNRIKELIDLNIIKNELDGLYLESNSSYNLNYNSIFNNTISYSIESLNASIINNKIEVNNNSNIDSSIITININSINDDITIYTGGVTITDCNIDTIINNDHNEDDLYIIDVKVEDIIDNYYILRTNNNYILSSGFNISLKKGYSYTILINNLRRENNIIISNINSIIKDSNLIINNSLSEYNLSTFNNLDFKKIKLVNNNGLIVKDSIIKKNDNLNIRFYNDYLNTLLSDKTYEYLIGYPISYSSNTIYFIVTESKVLDENKVVYSDKLIDKEGYIVSVINSKSYLVVNDDLITNIVYSNSSEALISAYISISNDSSINIKDESIYYSYNELLTNINNEASTISNIDLIENNIFYLYKDALIKSNNDNKIILELLNGVDKYNYQLLIDESYNYTTDLTVDNYIDILLISINNKIYFIIR